MTPTPEMTEPPARGLRGRTVAILIAIAFIAGLIATGFVMTRWQGWRSMGGPATLVGKADAGNETAAASPTDPIDPQVLAVPDDSISLAETAAREAQLSGRIAALESRLATIDLRAAAASGNAARAEGLLVAFAARRAIDRGLGLGYIEAQLRDRFGESQPRAVAVVIQAARRPVTLEALRLGLDDLAPTLASPTGKADWWQTTKRELASLIVVRRTNTPSPRAEDRLARARRYLEGGQVDSALAEVARLPGAPRAGDWMRSARTYIQARRALDVLETAAIVDPQRSAAAAATLASPPLPTPPEPVPADPAPTDPASAPLN